MPNLRIKHQGMGWPIMAVVGEGAFPHGYKGHVKIGALEETDHPITHEFEGLPSPVKSDADLAKQNQQLRARVIDLESKNAGLLEDNAEKAKKIAELATVNAEQTELLEQMTGSPSEPGLGPAADVDADDRDGG